MSLINPDNPADIRDARLLGLYRYWRSKCAPGMPARRDIDPIEMKAWLGNLLLIEFPPDPLKYRIRLEGVNIVHFYGSTRQGKGIETLTSEDERRLLLGQYFAVLDRGQPAYYEAEFVTSEGIPTFQRKLLLPLSEDGEHVNMVLVGLYFDRSDRPFFY